MSRRIGIIGAGVGGLAAALACSRAGLEYSLFDHAANPLVGGFALTLWPNARHALIELGVSHGVVHGMEPIELGEIRSAANVLLHQLPLTWMRQTFGVGPTCVQRSDLLQSLYDGLGRPTIHRGHCIGVKEGSRAVSAHFDTGASEHFDGAIAADGIHSLVRAKLGGKSARTFPYMAWRGIATSALVPKRSMREYWGQGVRFGYATINESTTYWFATVNMRLISNNEDLSWTDACHLFRGFPEEVESCIRTTPEKTVLGGFIQENPPGMKLANGRIALLGDCAHAMTPNLGFGAALALEDACTIARCLASDRGVKEAFAAYAKQRQSRVALMAHFTRKFGEVMQWERGRTVRDGVMRAVPDMAAKGLWKFLMGQAVVQ